MFKTSFFVKLNVLGQAVFVKLGVIGQAVLTKHRWRLGYFTAAPKVVPSNRRILAAHTEVKAKDAVKQQHTLTSTTCHSSNCSQQ